MLPDTAITRIRAMVRAHEPDWTGKLDSEIGRITFDHVRRGLLSSSSYVTSIGGACLRSICEAAQFIVDTIKRVLETQDVAHDPGLCGELEALFADLLSPFEASAKSKLQKKSPRQGLPYLNVLTRIRVNVAPYVEELRLCADRREVVSAKQHSETIREHLTRVSLFFACLAACTVVLVFLIHVLRSLPGCNSVWVLVPAALLIEIVFVVFALRYVGKLSETAFGDLVRHFWDSLLSKLPDKKGSTAPKEKQ